MNQATAQASRRGGQLDDTARALADPTRRHIRRLVRDNESSAGDLAAEFTHLSRPAVSQHLRVLHDADLVTVRRHGNRRMYRGRPEGLDDMRTFIDEMWTDRLARLKRAAELVERPAPSPRRQKGRSQ